MKLTEHFKLEEFTCKDGIKVPTLLVPNVQKLCDQLEIIRLHCRKPLHIISGYRTESYNNKVGGAKHSEHCNGKAADIIVPSLEPQEVYKIISTLIRNKQIIDGGLGLYTGWIHYDIGKSRRWSS